MTENRTNTTKMVALETGETITLYWSDTLGWVTIPEDDE